MDENSNRKSEDPLTTFASALWDYTESRSYGKTPEYLKFRAKQLARQKRTLDELAGRKQIGESLAGLVLNKIIQFSRDCAAYLSDSKQGPLDDVDHVEGLQFRKAILIQTICRLDGVFGIDSQKLLSIADSYWNKMAEQGTTSE